MTLLFFLASAALACAQAGDEAVRVTVTMNPDGSKTVYETNGPARRKVATTTGPDGKTRGKIIYRLDAAGRYETGQVFAPNGAFRFQTLYHYDAAGRLAEETQLDKNKKVKDKIVYSFDAEGQPSGYAVYDGEGRLLGRTAPKGKK